MTHNRKRMCFFGALMTFLFIMASGAQLIPLNQRNTTDQSARVGQLKIAGIHKWYFYKDLMLTMRDGVKLATTIYSPQWFYNEWLVTKHPTILIRTPYNAQSQATYAYVWYYISLGYNVVTQDTRGQGSSKGQDCVFGTDAYDGADTIAYINAYGWSNGNIATVGGSALGCVQYAVAPENPTNLKAQSIMTGGPNQYEDIFYNGGAFQQDALENWLASQSNTAYASVLINHPYEVDPFYNLRSYYNGRAANVNVRSVQYGGWFDYFMRGTLQGYQYYNNYGTSFARNHQILIMGPTTHGPSIGITVPNQGLGGGDYFASENALFGEEMWGNTINWTTYPKVQLFVWGAEGSTNPNVGIWENFSSWPVPNTPTPIYLVV